MTQNVDDENKLQDSPISRYLKGIWTNIIVYTLLDTFTALVILVFVFIPVVFVYFITRSFLNISIRHIAFSFFVLTILYMLSILIFSWWRHNLLVKTRTTKLSQPVDNNQPEQRTSPPGTSE